MNMRAVLRFLLVGGLLMRVLPDHAAEAPPLALRLEPMAAIVQAGNDVVLRLHVDVRRRLDMEMVELNLHRTRIRVESLDSTLPPREFTGQDYVQRERAAGRWGGPRMVGREFVAEAGDRWDTELNLSAYAGRLAAGRYRIGLTYRWGDAKPQVVAANSVEVIVGR